MSTSVTRKRKVVADGLFNAELHAFLSRELASEGYAGVKVRKSAAYTDIIIHCTRAMPIASHRKNELQFLIRQRFNLNQERLRVLLDKISFEERNLNAAVQCEMLRSKLKDAVAVRRACYGIMRSIMESNDGVGAKGCEIIISGKLRAQRAKVMKFRTGYMIHSGDAANKFVTTAVRHLNMKQGVIGIKVKIMLPSQEDVALARAQSRGGFHQSRVAVQVPQPDVIHHREPRAEEPAVPHPVAQKINYAAEPATGGAYRAPRGQGPRGPRPAAPAQAAPAQA